MHIQPIPIRFYWSRPLPTLRLILLKLLVGSAYPTDSDPILLVSSTAHPTINRRYLVIKKNS
ncbi:hypothetical protein LYNGBM3L_19330 [Moorena producens 3L]|uniref:Uncharacterized protein n=1 Tax=Moorena producens 3L TaxID=489825 RepID=F4XSQ9_9CYAN|nr:hypothetical protein LYNGBM3L_19330 [Moorena producens 3L]